METFSYFIKNKALFGSFPSQKIVNELQNMGVVTFIDLTCYNERVRRYRTKGQYLRYPIPDRGCPENKVKFGSFVLYVCDIIRNLEENEKIYVHCIGGHGRSGILVASILCLYYKIHPKLALKLTNRYHDDRLVMRECWRKLGSPQYPCQKEFVLNLFETENFVHPCLNQNISDFKELEKLFSKNSELKESLIKTGLGKIESLTPSLAFLLMSLRKRYYRNI